MSLRRNILWSVAGFLWVSLIVVLVTPYIVRKLGLESFGVWAIITASTGYLTGMDLGIGNALIRFLAAGVERSDRKSIDAFLRSGIALHGLLAVAAASPLYFGSDLVVRRWLHLSPELLDPSVQSFRWAAAAVLLGFLSSPLSALAAAVQRFDLLAARSFLFFSAQFGLTAGVLLLGAGLVEVVQVFVVVNAAWLLFLILVLRKLQPGLDLKPGWDASSIRELLRFGRVKFPAQLAATLLQQFDRLALGLLFPAGQVAFYAVPQRISLRIGQAAEQLAAPFYPAGAAHLTGNRPEIFTSQYLLGIRGAALVACGSIAILGGLAHPILAVWMGADFAQAGSSTFRLLLLAYAASALFTLPSVAADAAGRPGVWAHFMVIGALVHVPVVLYSAQRWGLPGAASGVLIGFLIPLCLGSIAVHRALRTLPSLGHTIRKLPGILIAGMVTYLAAALAARTDLVSVGALSLLSTMAMACLLYGVLLLLFRGIVLADLRRLIYAVPRRGHPAGRT